MARERTPPFVRDPNESYYDAQQVCLNGHQITTRYHNYPNDRRNFCEKCGEKTTHQCPKCRVDIKGRYVIPGAAASFETPVPEYCHNCGAPYPWEGKTEKVAIQVLGEMATAVSTLELIANRFHVIAKQLRSRHQDRATLDIVDEYDVQDLVHALLRLFFEDIRPEEWTPSYAGGASRMDFLLKQESIVVETKKTGPKHGGKEIGEDLIVDIAKYREHPSCKKLFCIVYDPEERITNPRGLEQDLSRKERNLEIKVIVTPKRY